MRPEKEFPENKHDEDHHKSLYDFYWPRRRLFLCLVREGQHTSRYKEIWENGGVIFKGDNVYVCGVVHIPFHFRNIATM